MTECASGAYAYTPVLASMVGASVIAVGKDSSYGTFAENKKNIEKICEKNGTRPPEFLKKIEVEKKHLEDINIITNSGMLRPINNDWIDMLPDLAVVPLMWETWEFRKADIDIVACQKKGIPVIGTNESFPSINMFGYNAFIVFKLLFDLGIEIHNNTIILLGGGKSGNAAYKGLLKNNINVFWLTKDGEGESKKYSELIEIMRDNSADAIINFEHEVDEIILGTCGEISFEKIKKMAPFIKYGHVCGKVNQMELERSAIDFLPKKILPFGYMSYETQSIGLRPVIELAAMGLKVGEIAARERLKGKSAEDAILKTLEQDIGQDFPGGFFNYS